MLGERFPCLNSVAPLMRSKLEVVMAARSPGTKEAAVRSTATVEMVVLSPEAAEAAVEISHQLGRHPQGPMPLTFVKTWSAPFHTHQCPILKLLYFKNKML